MLFFFENLVALIVASMTAAIGGQGVEYSDAGYDAETLAALRCRPATKVRRTSSSPEG
jgi:hypothetical protein